MKSQITIKRPSGNTEVVEVEKFAFGINDNLFEQIKVATRNAGRGECLSYKNIIHEIKLTQAEKDRNAVSKLFARAESLQDSPGELFPALQKAENALESWKKEYPAEAKTEAVENKKAAATEAARRKKELANSWIGKNLD